MVKHVTNLTIYGLSFDYGEDTICLGDGGEHETFILEQAIFRAIIDFGSQADFMTKDLSFKAYTYCDYAELYVEQLDKDTVSIYSQFHDGSEREEIQCSATVFYSAFFKYLDSFFEIVFVNSGVAENVRNSFRNLPNGYTLEQHFEDYKLAKLIVQKMYCV